MNSVLSSTTDFLEHIHTSHEAFVVRRGGMGPEWTDGPLHYSMFANDPELYALLALTESITRTQRMRVLYTLLEQTRVGLAPNVRATLERVTGLLLALTHPDDVLTVFLGLRRARANHKHTSRAIVRYILNHPYLVDMAKARRPTLVDCLEHAIGRDVARGSVRFLTQGGDEAYARRRLLRFAQDRERVGRLLTFLFGHELSDDIALADVTGNGQYSRLHQQYVQSLQRLYGRPDKVTSTNRGDIAATLVHIYQGGSSPEMEQALVGYVEAAARDLPRFEGSLALVIDASTSTRGYGGREFCIIAQSLALQLVLEQNCADLRVYRVGGIGSDRLPMPGGATDLAERLVEALEGKPDLVAIVSDGYENSYPGDLDRTAATLPQVGVDTPIVFCHSKFSHSDDLTLRRPAPGLLQLEFWHQSDFEELLLRLFARAGSNNSIRKSLLDKLSTLEMELNPWTIAN